LFALVASFALASLPRAMFTPPMKTIEYKHLRYEWSIGTNLSEKKFDAELMKMLTEYGQQGWDLKGILGAGGLHANFIFGREVS
jgi:hypothetical protein